MFEALRTYCMLLRADRRGVTAVEYAVIAAVMAVAVGGAFTTWGNTLQTFFTNFKFSG